VVDLRRGRRPTRRAGQPAVICSVIACRRATGSGLASMAIRRISVITSAGADSVATDTCCCDYASPASPEPLRMSADNARCACRGRRFGAPKAFGPPRQERVGIQGSDFGWLPIAGHELVAQQPWSIRVHLGDQGLAEYNLPIAPMGRCQSQHNGASRARSNDVTSEAVGSCSGCTVGSS
jgi:hypothetical protein